MGKNLATVLSGEGVTVNTVRVTPNIAFYKPALTLGADYASHD